VDAMPNILAEIVKTLKSSILSEKQEKTRSDFMQNGDKSGKIKIQWSEQERDEIKLKWVIYIIHVRKHREKR